MVPCTHQHTHSRGCKYTHLYMHVRTHTSTHRHTFGFVLLSLPPVKTTKVEETQVIISNSVTLQRKDEALAKFQQEVSLFVLNMSIAPQKPNFPAAPPPSFICCVYRAIMDFSKQ